MADTYGRSFTGLSDDGEGHLRTRTTLTYGPSGEQATSNLLKGQAVRAARSRAQCAALKTRIMAGSGANWRSSDGLPVRAWRD